MSDDHDETGPDAGPDDTRPDAGPDDTPPDAGPDDARPDAGPDGGPDDTRPDAGPDDTAEQQPTETPGAEPADGDHASSTLEAIAQSSTPPRPPRRTGVFLDPDDLRTHVGGLLRAILGGYEVDAFGNYTFTHEGARIFVTVNGSPIGPQVGVFSVTNVDVELTPDLATFLVTTNHTLGFGAFSYDAGNRAVWLRHTLLGTTLDGPELQSAVAAVATTAARLDHPIRDRFGGGTFADAPDDVQRGVEPPQVDPEPPAPNASGYL